MSARGAAARPLEQLMGDGKEERGSLSATGHGAGEHVAAFERRGNGVGLNGRGARESELFDASEKIAMKFER
jgi:hypothetical protein